MDLVKIVVDKTGVSEDQARAGLGLVLNMLKSQIGEEMFSKLVGFIPGSAEMIAAAPDASGGVMGAIGGLVGGGAGDLAKVASGFSDLGIDQANIPAFVGSVAEAAKDSGEDGLAEAIAKAAP